MTVKYFSCLAALAAVLTFGARVSAQDPNHQLSVSDATALAGETVTLEVNYSNASPNNVAGWSYGVGHNVADLTLVAGSVVNGSTTATVKGGLAPDFNQINELAAGWTVGVVISFIGTSSLPPGSGYELNLASYTLSGLAAGETSDVCFSSTLGMPPVAVVVVVSGQSVIPVQSCGTVSAATGPPPFEYVAPMQDVAFDATSVTVPFGIRQNTTPVLQTQGFSMGLSNVPADLTPTGPAAMHVLPIGELATLGPDFVGAQVLPNGWTVGVVYSFVGAEFLSFGVLKNVISVDYTINGSPSIGDSTPLTWTDSLGMPPVANVVVIAGQSVAAGFVNGAINFIMGGPQPVTIIRSDCNQDGINNVADGIFTIGTMFYGYSEACLAACDANADGMVDISDAMFTISYQFLDGPAPSAPYPNCGSSSAAGDIALGCVDTACP